MRRLLDLFKKLILSGVYGYTLLLLGVTMQYNYKGSVAQRNVRFTSGIKLIPEDASVENFNSLLIYVPSRLATANIVDYEGTGLTDDVPIVKTVTADNFSSVLQGDLLSQVKEVFADGANIQVTMYVVVFKCENDTAGTALQVSAKTINFPALTNAFNLTYWAAYFKFMFDTDYTGTGEGVTYCDLALCLAQLCENETTISACPIFVKLTLAASGDTSLVKVLQKTALEEQEAMTSLDVTIASVDHPRVDYFWGALKIINSQRVYMLVHTESNYIWTALALWFSKANAQGIYVGNKLDYVRLSGDSIKPTGIPSVLNAEANDNLTDAQYTILDSKNVGYLMSIADGTLNNAVISHFDAIKDGIPVLAPMISKYIDYHCSQDLAKWLTANETLTDPVLKSEAAYAYIQDVLTGYLSLFVSLGRLRDPVLNFPPYSQQTAKDSFTVVQGWEATYVDDLHEIAVSGMISV